jgi:hypothetical protein
VLGVAVAWTQTLSFGWRPQLRFYEERIPVLRDFEDAEVLKAFAVNPDSIGARVLDAGHQITVRQDGLSVDLFGQTADVAEMQELLTQAVSRIEPDVFVGLSVRFAHIVSLSTTFEEAVARSIAPLLPASGDNRVSCTDHAILLDLRAPSQVTAQIEYGILRSSVEARFRLGGTGTRVAPVSPAVREQTWETAKFPEVSLFADSLWREEGQREHHQLQEIWGFWADAAQYAADLVESLARPLDSEQKGRDFA